MADNVNITPGTGNIVAADEVTDGTLGTVKVQYTKVMDGTIDSTNKLVVSAAGAAKVDGSAVTQPISGTVTANAGTNLNTSALALDANVTALIVTPGTANSGQKGSISLGAVTTAAPTYTTATLNTLSLTTAGALRTDSSAVTQPVSGTFFQATQPVSGTVTTTPPANASTNLTQVNSVALGSPSAYGTSPGAVNVIGVNANITNPVQVASANLIVSATGAAAAAVTATLPAVAGQFHYITGIEIVAYSTVARTGTATVVLVTSTNLPGSIVWDFQSAAAIGTSERQTVFVNSPIKSSTVNTATTIVAPATTSVIWRINVYYFTAA